MNKEFRESLDEAVGYSEFIVAVNADIRGFSSFSKNMDSMEVAMFIKRVYMKIIDEYFAGASFFKPTGDGLLVILPYSEADVSKAINNTMDYCLKLLLEFPSICIGDPMINFNVPQLIGIGISRGSACRLTSGDKTLDYSGRVLNLASRLMNLARPSGIVFDSSVGIELLADKTSELFEKESVFLHGIAEREPIDIYYTKKDTVISSLSKQPIDEPVWQRIKKTMTVRQIKAIKGLYTYALPSKPIDPHQISVRVSHPRYRKPGTVAWYDFTKFDYALETGLPRLHLECDALRKLLTKNRVTNNTNVTIEIGYIEK